MFGTAAAGPTSGGISFDDGPVVSVRFQVLSSAAGKFSQVLPAGTYTLDGLGSLGVGMHTDEKRSRASREDNTGDVPWKPQPLPANTMTPGDPPPTM
jgi:hypothetical protein